MQGRPDSSLLISLGCMWRGSLHLSLIPDYCITKFHRLRGGWAGRCAIGLLHAPTLNIYPAAARDRMLLPTPGLLLSGDGLS